MEIHLIIRDQERKGVLIFTFLTNPLSLFYYIFGEELPKNLLQKVFVYIFADPDDLNRRR